MCWYNVKPLTDEQVETIAERWGAERTYEDGSFDVSFYFDEQDEEAAFEQWCESQGIPLEIL